MTKIVEERTTPAGLVHTYWDDECSVRSPGAFVCWTHGGPVLGWSRYGDYCDDRPREVKC